MPTVPRNTITETRIDRRPGVQSVTPRGAEGLGAIASAVGQQADLAGQKARVIGQQYDALQDIFGEANRMIVNVDRIQRIREARQVDEGELDYHQHMTRGTIGYSDPDTGERIQGAYETPFSPKYDQNEGSSAQQATAKLHAAWFEKKDGPFSRMSPRAQEAIKKRLTAKLAVYEGKARTIDKQNEAIRRKEIDEAASNANYDLMAQNAADPQLWAQTSEVAITSEAMRHSRHLMMDPEVATEGEIVWRDPEFQAVYEQTKKDIRAKATLHRANTLMDMADAAPDDATATRLLDDAVAFSKDAGDKGLLAPDAVAKVEKEAASVREQRDARAKAQEAVNVRNAKDLDLKAALGLIPQEQADAAMNLIDPATAELIKRDRHAFLVADDDARFREIREAYRDTGDEAELKRGIATLRTKEGRTRASLAMKQDAAQEQSERQKAITALEDINRTNMGTVFTTLAKAGITLDNNGDPIPMEPYDVRTRAIDAYEADVINHNQLRDIISTLDKRADENTLVAADAAMKHVAGRIGVDTQDLKKWLAFEAKQGFSVALNKKKTGPLISPDKVIGKFRWQDGIDDDEEVVKARVDLVCSMLNAAVDYARAPHLPGKGKEAPMTTDQFIDSLLTADVEGKVRKLDEAVIRRNTADAMMMTLGVRRQLEAKIAKAGLARNANQLQDKAATDDTETP